MNPFGVHGQRTPNQYVEWTAANRRAGREHERIQRDHDMPFGCDLCNKGTRVTDGRGWRSVVGLLFCPRCKNLVRCRQLIAETIAAQDHREALLDRAEAEE